MPKIGFIGGSGLYRIEGLSNLREEKVDTPWGAPSAPLIFGEYEGQEVVFLARHGFHHNHLPTEINVKANIAALKMAGVRQIVSFSAVGSLKEEIAPLHFVTPSQLIDRTRLRDNTYFGEGIVAHVSFGDPFCAALKQETEAAIEQCDIPLHCDETLVVMEGPAFSTRAESNLYRSWGCGVINMSALPEAKLAREAEMCYSLVCMSTDYDCWREAEEAVTADMIIQNLGQNGRNAEKVVQSFLKNTQGDRDCACQQSMRCSVVTQREHWPESAQQKLAKILPEVFG